MFREVLRRELERTTDAAAIAALHRSIAAWFATAGLTREAVQHLVALDDIPAATALIESRLSDGVRAGGLAVGRLVAALDSDGGGAGEPGAPPGVGVGRLPQRPRRPPRRQSGDDARRRESGDRVTAAQRAEIALLATVPEADPIAAIEVAEDAIAVIPPANGIATAMPT